MLRHYFVPQPSHWMIVGSFALLFMAGGAAMWFNGADVGRYGVLRRFRPARVHDVPLVRRRGARIRGRQVRQVGGRLVSLGHELVHLLGSDVLRRVLRRAVLCARAVGSRSGQPDQQGTAVAGFQRPVAERRSGLQGPVHADGGLGHPRAQHPAAAELGRDAHHRPLRHARGQPRQAEAVAVPDDRAGRRPSSASRSSNIPTPIPS